jgi:dienelactone hydrolase
MIFDAAHRIDLAWKGIEHPVYFDGAGPAVVLMHEIDGMTPECVGVADRIAAAGFTVYLPLFFGEPNVRLPLLEWPRALFCVRHEFNLLHSNGASPVAEWLRELCRRADKLCGGRGVGVIGLCLTGNVVLSAMLEPVVRVPVLCEPALPFGFGKSALGVPQGDVEDACRMAARSPILAYRFTTDTISPPERFCTLRATFGENIRTTEIATGEAALPWIIRDGSHPVLTGNYEGQDDPNHPLAHVMDEILGRLKSTLA